VDADGDGIDSESDCNDQDASIRPGLPEIKGNQVDENCDGVAEPAPPADRDGDRFGEDSDCNDGDPAIRPGAQEIKGNAVDENCDGLVEAAPPPDRDGDGFSEDLDCDDGDAAIRPGVQETRGNQVDENCDGLVEPFPPIAAGITHAFDRSRRHTLVTELAVTRLPAGATVEVTCVPPKRRTKPKPCAFKTRSITVRAAGARVVLTGHFKRRKLAPGTVIRVVVRAPGVLGKFAEFTVQARRAPRLRDGCVAPGGGPTDC
jgi:hypothetical protein